MPSGKACSQWRKTGNNNVFIGRMLEIEGLSDLKREQAYASEERSAARCTIKMNKEPRTPSPRSAEMFAGTRAKEWTETVAFVMLNEQIHLVCLLV